MVMRVSNTYVGELENSFQIVLFTFHGIYILRLKIIPFSVVAVCRRYLTFTGCLDLGGRVAPFAKVYWLVSHQNDYFKHSYSFNVITFIRFPFSKIFFMRWRGMLISV